MIQHRTLHTYTYIPTWLHYAFTGITLLYELLSLKKNVGFKSCKEKPVVDHFCCAIINVFSPIKLYLYVNITTHYLW